MCGIGAHFFFDLFFFFGGGVLAGFQLTGSGARANRKIG